MAGITKSRARKALAAGQLSYSWSNFTQYAGYPDTGERYNLSLMMDERTAAKDNGTWLKLSLSPKEAISTIAFIAGHMTWEPVPSYALDKRSVIEKLRALADKLEAESNMQRMELQG